jgi:predicted CxxxxCH...CXXCH cytochrome family protein
MRRVAALTALLLLALLAGVIYAASVLTDGDMEAAGVGAWPLTNVTGTNTSAKATDQKDTGSQSLKGTSLAGSKQNVEWYNGQSAGTINPGDTVRLSLWWGAQFNVSIAQGAVGTLYADLVRSGGAATRVWSQTLTPSLTFQSGRITTQDVSASITTSDTYTLRVGFIGKTGGNAGASINTWYDNVVLDVTPAVTQTTTVGDGSNPAGATICSGAREVDAFTLQTNIGSDVLTNATVTLSGGSAAALALVEITSDDGVTVHGSATNPASDTISIPLGITAGTTITQYKIRITPKAQAALTGTSSFAVTARVTAISSPNPKTYDDANSATITIDNTPTADATWGANSVGDGSVVLQWTNPADADLDSVVIVRQTTSPITAVPGEGQTYSAGNFIGAALVRFAGNATTFTDTSVVNGTTYTYKIFARDACGNYAGGVQSAALTPTVVEPKTTAGVGSATVDSCNQITVRAPFSGDSPSNSTTKVEYANAIGGPWSPGCASLAGASPRTCALSTLSPSTTYYFRVTFTDVDGFTGQNPQIVGPWTTPATCTQSATTAGTATAQASACRQITVLAPFTGDGDRDGSVSVERNTSNSWPGTVGCASLTGASPRQCLVTDLNPSTQYWLRVQYGDPDGGSATQVLGPLTTSACGADTAPPMVMFLAPARGAVLGGTERAKLQVWDTGGLTAVNPVVGGVDGGAMTLVATKNDNYSCGTDCAVYELVFDTSALANGEHALAAQATDAAGNVGRADQPFVVNNGAGGTPRGTGTLLRRTHGSQLCVDCHAIGSHSSQSTRSTKYGNWGYDCLTCHTPHQTPNVKLVRPTIGTPSSGTMGITLRTVDKAGGTNPQNSLLGTYDASGAPTNDGVCEACHTKTLYHRNDASGDHAHNQGARCTGCHAHIRGFKSAKCFDCHNAPPTIGKHRVKHDEVWDSTSGKAPSAYADGSSHATATQYGFACAKCHAGVHENDKNNPTHDGTLPKPWAVEVIFNGAGAGGSYSATYNANTDVGADGQYFSWSNGSCSNTYCHSNAAPLGGTNVPAGVTWNQAASTTCTSCHKTTAFGDGAADGTALSKSHAKHIQSTSGETGTYTFECDECHAATIRDNPSSPWALASADLVDKRLHVNEKKDVVFSSTLLATTIDQSAGGYDDVEHSCSGTYCHSPGTKTSNFDAPNFVLKWGMTSGCHSCHGGNAASASPISTGRHANHVSNATLLGVTFPCETCHNATASGDTTVTSYTNHVNGTANVVGTSTGTYTRPNCTDSRCHSSGQRLGTREYYSVDWSADVLDCKGCHGRHSDNAFVSIAGEPNTTTSAVLSKYNSHRAHVSSAADCANCHAATVGTSGKIDGTTPSRHLDHDGTPDVVYAAKYSGATYTASTRACTVSCHGSGTPVWGGAAMVCADCHVGANDVDNWTIDDGVVSIIGSNEWATKGHGTAAIALPGANPCLYCHTTATGHNDAANPFRLANTGGADGANGACLICHKTGSAGYNPGSGAKNGTKKIDSYHYATKHSAGANGGLRCWDCHDAHGDSNIKMIGRLAIKTSADSWGLSATWTNPITFTANAAAGDYVSSGPSITATGVCNVCHTTAGHYKATSGDTHGTTAVCTSSCHSHSQAAATDGFKNPAGGGDCLFCHGGSTQGPRRAVSADFNDGTSPNFRSHHVGNGTANALKGTLNNFDCVVCHAEGKIVAGATDTDGQPHMDGKIDLRNVDSTTAYFTYDKDAVTTSAGANLAQWSSANAVWRTQTSTALDPFCLACHDANGATQIATLGESGATAANPFKETQIANNYDQLVRPGVVDIKSKVSGNPPTQGTFARHAIRGQSTSVYTKYTGALSGCVSTPSCKPIYDYGFFVQNGTDENAKPNWNDTSVMGCADCHTTDGANGSTGNAHGSSSEYLLKNNAGAATEGTMAGVSYICYRCHIASEYSSGSLHANNNGDYQDYTGSVGTARVPAGNTGGSRFGIACMNCHGGGPGTTDGTNGYGWIHGTNQTFYVGYTTSTRNAYRFMNGGSMRFWDPNGWNTTSGTCWTLGGTGRPADQWGGCTKHDGSAGQTRSVYRPLTY